MTIAGFIVAGLESAPQKGLLKNSIHHSWKLPGTLLQWDKFNCRPHAFSAFEQMARVNSL